MSGVSYNDPSVGRLASHLKKNYGRVMSYLYSLSDHDNLFALKLKEPGASGAFASALTLICYCRAEA